MAIFVCAQQDTLLSEGQVPALPSFAFAHLLPSSGEACCPSPSLPDCIAFTTPHPSRQRAERPRPPGSLVWPPWEVRPSSECAHPIFLSSVTAVVPSSRFASHSSLYLPKHLSSVVLLQKGHSVKVEWVSQQTNEWVSDHSLWLLLT